MPKKKVIWQNHHIIYKSDRNKRDVTRKVRKGLHQVLTLLRRFKYLNSEEINAILIECELRRKFDEKE